MRQQRIFDGAPLPRGPRSLPGRQSCARTTKPRTPLLVQRNADRLQHPVLPEHGRTPLRNATPLGHTNDGTHKPRRLRPPSRNTQRCAEPIDICIDPITSSSRASIEVIFIPLDDPIFITNSRVLRKFAVCLCGSRASKQVQRDDGRPC